MRKLLLTLGGILAFSLTSIAQDIGKEVATYLQDCECDEVIMITGALEKKYSHSWLESIEYKDGFIVFSKGSQKHRWNPEKVIFVEKSATWVRVYLEKAR
jgi:hypothetical protein